MARDPLENPAPLIRRVYGYVAYRLGEGEAAEDVTSAVFERALRYRATYDPARGNPEAWLIGIARRCIAEALADSNRSAASADPAPDTAGHEDDTIDRLVLHAALARLGDRDRELIALRYGSDLKADEIARVTGERTNTVEVALHRALGRLRSLLEGDLDDDPRASSPPAVRI